MTISQIRRFARIANEEFNLRVGDVPIGTADLSRRPALGVCYYTHIEIDARHAAESDPLQVYATVLHELLHAHHNRFLPGGGHDAVYRILARAHGLRVTPEGWTSVAPLGALKALAGRFA